MANVVAKTAVNLIDLNKILPLFDAPPLSPLPVSMARLDSKGNRQVCSGSFSMTESWRPRFTVPLVLMVLPSIKVVKSLMRLPLLISRVMTMRHLRSDRILMA